MASAKKKNPPKSQERDMTLGPFTQFERAPIDQYVSMAGLDEYPENVREHMKKARNATTMAERIKWLEKAKNAAQIRAIHDKYYDNNGKFKSNVPMADKDKQRLRANRPTSVKEDTSKQERYYKKYPHVVPNSFEPCTIEGCKCKGAKASFLIRCQVCGDFSRRVHSSDVFQVKRCEEHSKLRGDALQKAIESEEHTNSRITNKKKETKQYGG